MGMQQVSYFFLVANKWCLHSAGEGRAQSNCSVVLDLSQEDWRGGGGACKIQRCVGNGFFLMIVVL